MFFWLASVKTAILVEFYTGRWQVPCLIILQGFKVCSVLKVAVDTPGTPTSLEHLSNQEKRLQQTGVSNVLMRQAQHLDVQPCQPAMVPK